jgi:hypothetical protein
MNGLICSINEMGELTHANGPLHSPLAPRQSEGRGRSRCCWRCSLSLFYGLSSDINFKRTFLLLRAHERTDLLD